jgi:hypothetical protein
MSSNHRVYSFASLAAAKAMLLTLARVFSIGRAAMRIENDVYERDGKKATSYSTIMLVPENLPEGMWGAEDLCGRMITFVQGYMLGKRQAKSPRSKDDGIAVSVVVHKAIDYGELTTNGEAMQ